MGDELQDCLANAGQVGGLKSCKQCAKEVKAALAARLKEAKAPLKQCLADAKNQLKLEKLDVEIAVEFCLNS